MNENGSTPPAPAGAVGALEDEADEDDEESADEDPEEDLEAGQPKAGGPAPSPGRPTKPGHAKTPVAEAEKSHDDKKERPAGDGSIYDDLPEIRGAIDALGEAEEFLESLERGWKEHAGADVQPLVRSLPHVLFEIRRLKFTLNYSWIPVRPCEECPEDSDEPCPTCKGCGWLSKAFLLDRGEEVLEATGGDEDEDLDDDDEHDEDDHTGSGSTGGAS